ncbi:hypothetical protein K438DRAFT_2026744 [Mycena galopus ATCC 62051]|nr:hypothetical protein K438DRAFT_2026744 [Mycena galopus ATCC 62051]
MNGDFGWMRGGGLEDVPAKAEWCNQDMTGHGDLPPRSRRIASMLYTTAGVPDRPDDRPPAIRDVLTAAALIRPNYLRLAQYFDTPDNTAISAPRYPSAPHPYGLSAPRRHRLLGSVAPCLRHPMGLAAHTLIHMHTQCALCPPCISLLALLLSLLLSPSCLLLPPSPGYEYEQPTSPAQIPPCPSTLIAPLSPPPLCPIRYTSTDFIYPYYADISQGSVTDTWVEVHLVSKLSTIDPGRQSLDLGLAIDPLFDSCAGSYIFDDVPPGTAGYSTANIAFVCHGLGAQDETINFRVNGVTLPTCTLVRHDGNPPWRALCSPAGADHNECLEEYVLDGGLRRHALEPVTLDISSLEFAIDLN